LLSNFVLLMDQAVLLMDQAVILMDQAVGLIIAGRIGISRSQSILSHSHRCA